VVSPDSSEEVAAHSGAVRIRGRKKGPIASTGGDVTERERSHSMTNERGEVCEPS
jgi:hypothetical protein